MPPVSASKAKRQAEKAAKAAKKSGKDTPRDTDSINGSTAVDSSSATAVDEDGDTGLGDMKKLAIATDR
jgi:ATP-binding cassette, subfamily F, member 2